MKILVFNGSPKVELSVTLQYIRYLEMVISEHEFEIVPVAQKIKTLKRFVPRIREGMVSPLKKVVDRIDEKGL
ncbi:MAG: NAD(P)H-dependent oxidoreductase [Desulfohalobiaceae bacterium]|nr:NAD(P)H-dependent oxidoreductase [Desulfohalobiaceae bacterium]